MNFKELASLGLTEGEAKVYLALTSLGASTVGPIAHGADVAYSNIYEILNRLIDKGVVSFIVKGKTRHYQAASPQNLVEYLDRRSAEIAAQRERLTVLLPQILEMQHAAKRNEAEVFVGTKAMRTAYEKMLSSGEPLKFFYIHDPAYERDADLFYLGIHDLFKKRSHRGIANQHYRTSKFFKKAKGMLTRFVDFPIPGNIEVCGDKILIISWAGTVTGVLIHSEDIAKNFIAYFDEVWEKGSADGTRTIP